MIQLYKEIRILEFIRICGGANNKEIADNLAQVLYLDLDEIVGWNKLYLDELQKDSLVDIIEDVGFSSNLEKFATITSQGKVYLKNIASNLEKSYYLDFGNYVPNSQGNTIINGTHISGNTFLQSAICIINSQKNQRKQNAKL